MKFSSLAEYATFTSFGVHAKRPNVEHLISNIL